MFNKLIALINKYSNDGFTDASEKLNKFISTTGDFIEILLQIGTIPESISHDSTEEKLFSKASDAVLSRAFREIGLKSTVISERADAADVIARSQFHGYSLVADAKAFRLSRTAKNQKDFKVAALSGWRNDSDYAILCSPYFQYPRRQSQIYAQALDNNVCLLSWEHLIFLLEQGIRESEEIDLSVIWGFCEKISHEIVVAEKKKCFFNRFDIGLVNSLGESWKEFDKILKTCKNKIIERGFAEKSYWESERDAVSKLTREQAIEELIRAKKINEKIQQIDTYLGGIRSG
ncbi:MAG: HindIII family type II restriction endonuclease [Defluviitaleaceae bacterium]|nr:HindIII family type II restriction endonuclease [Defluviitaleaceae bacterium]